MRKKTVNGGKSLMLISLYLTGFQNLSGMLIVASVAKG